jgi:hypothetical protein
MTYAVKRGDSLSRIARRHDVTFADLLAANPRYKANPNLLSVGDTVEVPGQAPAKASSTKKMAAEKTTKTAKKARAAGPFAVPYGQLTFDAEGSETRGRFFSRVAHVPGAFSGMTIGRGYDMGSRSESEIIADLTAAGVDEDTAKRFAAARGLKGTRASNFVKQKKLKEIEITPEQQKALFLITYKELEGDVIRISTKADVVHKYGRTDWDILNPLIKDVLVDLRYRGDYTGTTREVVQPSAVKNLLAEFTIALTRRSYWEGRGVPRDRYQRRRAYLQKG